MTINSTGSLFALASDAPYRSTDGLNWTAIKNNIPDANFNSGGLINVDASNNLYVLNNTTYKMYSSSNSTVATAASVSWGSGISYPYTTWTTTSYFQNSTTWLIGLNNYGLSKTTNGGTGWSFSSQGIKALYATKIYYTSGSTNSGRIFIGWYGIGYYLSIDEGATWTLIASGNTSRQVTGFLQLKDGSVLGYGSGVIRTADNGGAWTIQNGAQNLYNLVSNDGIHLYSFSGTNLLTSSNQGVNWTTTAMTGFPASNYISKMVIDFTGNLYFYLYDNGVSQYKVYMVNAGTTAANPMAPPISNLSDISTFGNTLYVINSNSLITTANGGSTWTPAISTPTGNRSLWVYDANNLFVQGNQNAVFRSSSDAGATWSTINLQDPTARVTDLVVSAQNYAYAATSNSVTQKSLKQAIRPVTPTGLVLNAKTFQTIDLIWNDNATNETWYRLERSADNITFDSVGGFSGAISGSQNLGNTSDFVSANTTYYYRVAAGNGAGLSKFSNVVTVTSDNLVSTTIPDNRSWTATTVVTAGGSGTYGPLATVAINLVANTTNQFTVSAYGLGSVPPAIHAAPTNGFVIESSGNTYFLSTDDIANGNGTRKSSSGKDTIVLKWQSNVTVYDKFQATTTLVLNATDPVPAIPTLNAYVYSSTGVFLNWNQIPFAQQYVIERSLLSGSGFTPIMPSVSYPAVTFIDKNLPPATTYYYRISAKNGAGTSAPSAVVSVTLGNTLFSPVDNVADAVAQNFDSQQGVAWGDLDGDGLEDIVSPSFTNNAGLPVSPVIYQNMGGGAFNRINLSVLQNENNYVSRSVNVFDFNNDGKLDLYFARSSNNPGTDLLLINNGSWSFTKTYVSQTGTLNSAYRTSAAADFDKDKFVDVFVGDYSTNASPGPSLLLKNTGGTGFTAAAPGSLVTDVGLTREASWADYNNDGNIDIFVTDRNFTSSQQPNRLYKNNGDGTFTRMTGLVFDTDLFGNVRTSSWADIDNDGDLDLYVGSQSAGITDRLYRNNGDGSFTSLSSSPVAETGTATFGSSFGDINNDGAIDLIVMNNGANSIFLNSPSSPGTFTKYTFPEMHSQQ